MKIQFHLVGSFEIDHFGTVCQELLKQGIEADFYCPWPKYGNQDNAKLVAENAFRILEERNLPYTHTKTLNADAALCTQCSSFIKDYKHSKLKFRYATSLRKSSHNFHEENISGFNGILTHGQFEKNNYINKGIPENIIKIMGYPRYDSWFNKPRKEKKLKQKFTKKTILYLPTWGEHSSIDLFFPALKKLSNQYDIITKPHHHNEQTIEEQNRMDKLREISSLLVPNSHCLATLVDSADIIISDAKSGATSDTLFLAPSKPHITLTTPNTSIFHNVLFNICPVLTNPYNLGPILDAILYRNPYICERKKFNKYAFQNNYGQAAKDTAFAILELSKSSEISSKFFKKDSFIKRIVKKLIKK